MPTNDGIVSTPKEFSDALTLDLTDDEITQAMQITLRIRQKWQDRFRSAFRDLNFTVNQAMKMVDQFEDELKDELANKLNILVHVDAAPVFEGEPMVIEFMGGLPSHSSAKYGLDHEKKTWEVQKAKEKGQDFLGVDKLNR